MKKIWKKMTLLISAIISLVGFKSPAVQASIQFNQYIEKISKITPLYLQLCSDFNQAEKQKVNDIMTWHYSHISHQSHYSHVSHRSHYSHRSGY